MAAKEPDNKIVVVFRAAGGAPILAQPKVKLSGDSKFSKLVAFLRKQLKTDSVFVYLREAFCPSLDDDVALLTQAYGIEGRLHVSYALTPAWG
ncbi:ubiquitin [Raphidocelis subcapitata]|uniref:Ubiquitin-like protein ATG12 n=1 Tax=Raphidocelis subcapitata TaxID=307507 RepID=A0A2V0NYZ0_9CHLO|nr:ubiquitin [Raphidocelis subcapitata]|eukprot:GBF90810.1 ubiquitin [Raphidocelis subcapitata]